MQTRGADALRPEPAAAEHIGARGRKRSSRSTLSATRLWLRIRDQANESRATARDRQCHSGRTGAAGGGSGGGPAIGRVAGAANRQAPATRGGAQRATRGGAHGARSRDQEANLGGARSGARQPTAARSGHAGLSDRRV